MTLTIGRVGLDITIGDVSRWENRDRTTIVDFSVRNIGQPAAARLRDQLLGYVDAPDESFVPVTFDDDPSVDGFYRVLSVGIIPHPQGAFYGFYGFSITMEPVTGFSAPLMELRTLGAVRVNTHGLVSASQAICVPDTSRSVAFLNETSGSYIPFAPAFTRAGSRGSVFVYQQVSSQRYTTQFYVDPAHHYDGAATLLMGDTMAPVVGRQVPNTPTSWRLSNGLVEFEASSATDFELRMRMFLGGAFTAWVPFSILAGPPAGSRTPLAAPHAITVLRNSPNKVAVRLLTATSTAVGSQYSPVTVDITLKRGSRWAAFELNSVFTGRFGVRCAAFAGATLESSIYYWKTVASPLRMVMVGPQKILQSGNDVHPNEAAVTSVKAWSFMVGLADAANASDNVDDCVNEYMFAGSDTQAVVVQ